MDATQRELEYHGYRFTATDGDGLKMYLDMACYHNHANKHLYIIDAGKDWHYYELRPDISHPEITYHNTLEETIEDAMVHSIGACIEMTPRIVKEDGVTAQRTREKATFFSMGLTPLSEPYT